MAQKISLTPLVFNHAIKLQVKALFLRPEKEMLDRTKELRELPITFMTETSQAKNYGKGFS